MKKKIILLVAALIFSCSFSAHAGFWDKLVKAGKQVLEGAVGGYLQDACVNAGYSEDEATKMVTDTYEMLGLNTENAQKGIDWNNADNKYQRQNMAKDFIFDTASEIAGDSTFFSKFKAITDAQISYLDTITSYAKTDEEKKLHLTTGLTL